MNARATSTRDQIVEAAERLFYRRGFEHTSFSDIADIVKISRGNFYYHFKTKDEILDAVIDLRVARTIAMFEQWEAASDDPADRLRSFIHMWFANRAEIKRYGCPVGTLCSELSKLGHSAQPEARWLFTAFRTWLSTQFEQLDQPDADTLAMRLLARSQGVAALAQAFHDEKFIEREVEEMSRWLDAVLDHGPDGLPT